MSTATFNYTKGDGTPDWERIYSASGILTDAADGQRLYFGRTEIEMWELADYFLSPNEREILFSVCSTLEVYLVQVGYRIQEQTDESAKKAEVLSFALPIDLVNGTVTPPEVPAPEKVAATLTGRMKRLPPPPREEPEHVQPDIAADSPQFADFIPKRKGYGGRPRLLEQQAFWAISLHDYGKKEWKDVALLAETFWKDDQKAKERTPEAWRKLADRYRELYGEKRRELEEIEAIGPIQ